MRKVICLFIFTSVFFTCSNSDDGPNVDNIKFEKIHIYNNGRVCLGCENSPSYDSQITFMTSNLKFQEVYESNFLIGQGWIMDIILQCDLNENDLPEAGMYIQNRLKILPFTFYTQSLSSYNSNDDNFGGDVGYIESYVEGSYFEISYKGNIMNISYNLKMRDYESDPYTVDITMEGQFSTEINKIINDGNMINFHP